jgi:hypothetical protein
MKGNTVKTRVHTSTIALCAVLLSLTISSAYTAEKNAATDAKGHNCLFIGHSFFIPVAPVFKDFAQKAGIDDHSQQTVFSGGASGAPGSLWQNPQKRTRIQGVLNTGEVDLLGMTYYNRSNSSLDDYRQWIDYALKQNPKTQFFIGLAWGRIVNKERKRRDLKEYTASGHAYHEATYRSIVLELRESYPDNRIMCCYYGMASGELRKRFEAGELAKTKQLVGQAFSVYRDGMGHAGEILKSVSALVWLYTIYDIEPSEVDLHLKDDAEDPKPIATAIIANEAKHNAGSL